MSVDRHGAKILDAETARIRVKSYALNGSAAGTGSLCMGAHILPFSRAHPRLLRGGLLVYPRIHVAVPGTKRVTAPEDGRPSCAQQILHVPDPVFLLPIRYMP